MLPAAQPVHPRRLFEPAQAFAKTALEECPLGNNYLPRKVYIDKKQVLYEVKVFLRLCSGGRCLDGFARDIASTRGRRSWWGRRRSRIWRMQAVIFFWPGRSRPLW